MCDIFFLLICRCVRFILGNVMGDLLLVRNLCFGYGVMVVIEDVSLFVFECGMFVVLGCNGVGKIIFFVSLMG